MKLKPFLGLALALLTAATARADGRKTCIDKGWKFHYGAADEAVDPAYDDSGWRTLDLPHDWSVETEAAGALGDNVGPFSRRSVGGSQMGYTVGGEGWYRKTFTLDAADADKRIMLYFEGAYNQTTVWLNGRKIYFNHYGYQSFRFDATEFCNEPGQENTLAVRVVNSGSNTRWYAGSGIYRHVWLLKVPRLHLDAWKNFVHTPEVTDAKATVRVETTVTNELRKAAKADVQVLLYDREGALVASGRRQVSVARGSDEKLTFDLDVASPRRWSPADPYLYRAVVKMEGPRDGLADRLDTPFGIRTVEFSAEKGCLLNGEPILLRGGCVHHDNGLLGAAAFDAAENRKIALLKREGFNAVRTAHNIVSEHFLDACDSIGMLVLEESFDQWLVAKNDDDYHQYFAEFSDRDIQVMVARDRNHPSIILWGLGNEIPGRITDAGMAAAARLRSTVLALDPTRALTAAIPAWDSPNHAWSEDDDRAFQSLDVGGYNYIYDKYESDHRTHPERVMVGLETYPKRASENWVLAEKHPYVIGDFVWTAMDYLGEAGIGSASFRTSGSQPFSPGWPWFNGWCGDIDLIGTKKPQSYYRDVVWRRQPITMAVEEVAPPGAYMSISAWGWQLEHQSWTLDCKEGTSVAVNVYSRSPQVRLYLNGELLGTKPTSATFWAGFSVPYRPGELRAVEFDGQDEGASFVLETTGEPVALRLVADRSVVASNGSDLLYVTAELVDASGRVVYDSQRKVGFSVEGPGVILASGNACPNDMESFRSNTPRLYNGRAQTIVRTTSQPGDIVVRVESEGLEARTVAVKSAADICTSAAMPKGGAAPAFTVSSAGRAIRVDGADSYRVYNAKGQEVTGSAFFESGVYVVTAGGASAKIAVK